MQEQIHLRQHIGEWFRFLPRMLRFWSRLRSCDGLAPASPDVLEGFDQKAAGPARGIEHSFAEPGIDHRHHEAHDGPRRVELAGVAGRVAHLPEHGLVEVAERVNFFGRREVDAVDLVDDVAQQIAAFHAVLHAFEHLGNHLAPGVPLALLGQPAQIFEQAGAC